MNCPLFSDQQPTQNSQVNATPDDLHAVGNRRHQNDAKAIANRVGVQRLASPVMEIQGH